MFFLKKKQKTIGSTLGREIQKFDKNYIKSVSQALLKSENPLKNKGNSKNLTWEVVISGNWKMLMPPL